jgi:hypothetical protein
MQQHAPEPPSEEMCSEARMALFALLTFGKGQTQDVHTSMLPHAAVWTSTASLC